MAVFVSHQGCVHVGDASTCPKTQLAVDGALISLRDCVKRFRTFTFSEPSASAVAMYIAKRLLQSDDQVHLTKKADLTALLRLIGAYPDSVVSPSLNHISLSD